MKGATCNLTAPNVTSRSTKVTGKVTAKTRYIAAQFELLYVL